MIEHVLNTTQSANAIEISHADTVWVLVASAMIFLMVPGVGYYYGGICQRKNVLSVVLTTGLALAVVSFQWFFWGYSLSFAHNGSPFIGDLHNFALMKVGAAPHPSAPTIPENTYVLIQGMFACITPVLAFGSAAERTKLPAYLVFLFVWSTLVYNFCTYWCWAPHGWLHHYGVLDYAGGTPVHVCSGFAALAYALITGPRKTVNHKKLKPSSMMDVFMGTVLLWFGWFGFNGGSEFAINARAINAVYVSNLSASVGGITWMCTEMLVKKSRKMSLNGFCCGVVAGLVSITPAAGFTSSYYALIFGFVGSLVCFGCAELKHFILAKYNYDDACDVFAIHGMGGVTGCLLTGLFAENKIATMSGGAPIPGGWVDQHYMQILYQLLSIVVVALWSFVWTYAILWTINKVPFLPLQMNQWEERAGTDWVELGERAYGHDIEDYEQLKVERPPIVKKKKCTCHLKDEAPLVAPLVVDEPEQE